MGTRCDATTALCRSEYEWGVHIAIFGARVGFTPGQVHSLVHGGPGRAGGGEELGGERGLLFYMQRTAIQADQVVLKKILGME